MNRSEIMARVKSCNTMPERAVRSLVHRLGYRFRNCVADLPGKPDLVFPKYGKVIFVHGCFWHGHDCHLFKWPSTRKEFWHQKIKRNRDLDKEHIERLHRQEWRVLLVWECALKGKTRQPVENVIAQCEQWLRSSCQEMEIRGTGS